MNEEIHVNIKHGNNRADIAVINESLRSLDNADVSTTDISSGSQFRKHTIINEPELYQLNFQIRKPDGKQNYIKGDHWWSSMNEYKTDIGGITW